MNYAKMAEALKAERIAMWKQQGSPITTPTGREETMKEFQRRIQASFWVGCVNASRGNQRFRPQQTIGIVGHYSATITTPHG